MVFKSFSFKARKKERTLVYSSGPELYSSYDFALTFISHLPLPVPCLPAAPYAAGATCPDRMAVPRPKPPPAPLVLSRPVLPGTTRTRHAPSPSVHAP